MEKSGRIFQNKPECSVRRCPVGLAEKDQRRKNDSVARPTCVWHMNIFANDPIIRTPAYAALEFSEALRPEPERFVLVHAAAHVSHRMLTEIFIPKK